MLTTAVSAQRPQLTPEQQAEAAKRREAEMNAPRPIAAVDSVWTEELTGMEIRDASGRKIVELRTKLTVDAIDKAMGKQR